MLRFQRKTVISVLVNFRKYTVFIVRITAVVFIQSLRLTNVKELKIITNSRYLCNKFTHARYRQKRYRCRRTYMCCVYAVYFCHQFRTQNVKFVCDKYGLSSSITNFEYSKFSYVLVELSSFIILSSLIP